AVSCESVRLLLVLASVAALAAADRDWPAYGGGPAGIRYSPLRQINRSNVARLRVAWQFDTHETPGDPQTQPILVHGVLYGITPTHKAIALDGVTGKLRWTFDSGIRGRGANRGVTWWEQGGERRLFVAVQSFVYALDPETGKPIADFGNNGRIDLRENLGREPDKQSFVLTTPGIVYRELLIVGGRLPEALPAAPGDIRAYDVRTGTLRWTFHTIPRPGEFGYETWPSDAWTYTGAANNWPGMALDAQRGIVYAPTGSAASDFYGADRLGDNLFANSLLALNAATGERIWHFQAVRHDLWDRDFPSAPLLVTVKHNGRAVDAVAQASKQGWIYLFDRVTGTPLFPMQSHAYPASGLPGEKTAREQVLPLKPAPYARQSLTEDLLTQRTPQAYAWALERFRKMQTGTFLPFSDERDTLIFPGFDGGAEWGGQAFDPTTGVLYLNANEMAWNAGLEETQTAATTRRLYNQQCATCHGDDLRGAPPQIPALTDLAGKRSAQQIGVVIREGGGRMPAFPALNASAVTALTDFLLRGDNKELANNAAGANAQPRFRFKGYHKFTDPDGYPAIAPPWGTLNAINLNTGEYAWRIPFGEYPELSAKDTGSENYGGPIVTAGGLVFIAATNYDRKFRAFDKATGRLLWETTLPLAGNATPITYELGGRQYVVIYATGGKSGKWGPSGGIYIAFTL
ncbi:MAG TPA: PQQ-binding-like beta-propeller repeat protein, partial [Candidatus Solibacter sp.]|nr:PQQ-binding-like beta-propeller repeat protein [Candidatus Solibacter sp.]